MSSRLNWSKAKHVQSWEPAKPKGQWSAFRLKKRNSARSIHEMQCNAMCHGDVPVTLPKLKYMEDDVEITG